ncbi:MAG TPA: decaprenyl-phosphate phosphoribosyltransferase [Candidatus Acidoferrum sp.]|nr:decaprenyl-phosphate phosphoribosyltransferase [Candidatus Acidoferrum sp.]
MRQSATAIEKSSQLSQGRVWGVLRGLVTTVRPTEWLKNTLVFAAIDFSGNLFSRSADIHAGMVFVTWCLAASGAYFLNDLLDRKTDQTHPLKCFRPIASGLVSPTVAVLALVALFGVGIALGFSVNRGVGEMVLAYIVLTCAYSVWFKHVIILDVFVLATGFVLRVIAGAEGIGVTFSSWLVLCTFLLALFLGFGKRRHELLLLDEAAMDHRRVLRDYSPHFLDMMMVVVTSATVVCYALYTLDAATIARFGTNRLVYTSVFVLYGIFRYLFLIYQKSAGGNPSAVLYKDLDLRIDIALWVASVLFLKYYPMQLGK